ncbi:MAG: prevent-host-death family protein [Pseudomonadales bacterium]
MLAELRLTKSLYFINEMSASGTIVDVEDYEYMQGRMEILEGIARGEMAVFEGRTLSHSKAKEKMAKWLD